MKTLIAVIAFAAFPAASTNVDCPDHGMPMMPTIDRQLKADGKWYAKWECSWGTEKHYVWVQE